MQIAGTSALVTGGASGLGAATVRRLAARGARVTVVDLPGSAGAAVAAEVGGAFAPADVTDAAEVAAAVDVAAAAAPLRIVVSCAGIAPPAKVLGRDGEPTPLADFERVVRINLVGTYNVLAQASAAMARTEPTTSGDRGVIVNTASVAAFDGQIGQPAYAASKGAVHAMTLPIARELARHGIRVCTIAPGIMQTPMMAGLADAAQQSLGQQVPYPQRLGAPEEFADLAVHIVENDYLNGETIRLDGAIRMAPR
ncbi:SDR family NAD(P)-dependent oxidoreductase [Microbacterium imperiale]|uniref:3-hydroxyacyl-CoA dehydrogenase n=1 Tax=Microbacterium imperiale TaxID=33884 RepID=A0A9W6M446_9MICO|nr:SDR family NAD(P)-dependent oxidoreductase [Microbacterium imperiale]MBP2421380.1 NAD(P)-dependent dehydrogenase (short-subunit alcohol dehydrogenase family) [Microbacterium imperiale]MDS0199513.1 SDR family NAD(P)-dependent oxidoreductase [Microbacterium imperiale]BFE41719.1 SDR family NAD(P)-dependent oxidoreductase [Microbacterium imperiale]GLJ80671.1 3-hydroxyacyl-CoA dehydrogenase [Microbacterium imperiale]